jgi:hypothetical protein
MPTSSTGNPLKTLTDEQQDGTPTSKNTTTRSNTFLGTPTFQPTPYPDHPMPTKEKTTTKMLHSFPQKDLRIQHGLTPNTMSKQSATSWSYTTTIQQLDTLEETKRSEKSNNPTIG